MVWPSKSGRRSQGYLLGFTQTREESSPFVLLSVPLAWLPVMHRHIQEYEQAQEVATKAVEELRSWQEATTFSVDALQHDQDKVKKHLVKTQKEVQVNTAA